jgi:hypothetical protein
MRLYPASVRPASIVTAFTLIALLSASSARADYIADLNVGGDSCWTAGDGSVADSSMTGLPVLNTDDLAAPSNVADLPGTLSLTGGAAGDIESGELLLSVGGADLSSDSGGTSDYSYAGVPVVLANLGGVTGDVVHLPEPTTLGLLAATSGLLALRRRRQVR